MQAACVLQCQRRTRLRYPIVYSVSIFVPDKRKDITFGEESIHLFRPRQCSAISYSQGIRTASHSITVICYVQLYYRNQAAIERNKNLLKPITYLEEEEQEEELCFCNVQK